MPYKGNDRLLFGIIMGVVAFWLFAQTTLNIAPDMSRDLGVNASTKWLDGTISFLGRQDNLAVRKAAIVALGFNVLMVVVAIVSIMLTVPKMTTTQARVRSTNEK